MTDIPVGSRNRHKIICLIGHHLICRTTIQEVEEKETGTTTAESDTAKILELLKNPETAALLKQIVSAL